MQWNRIKTAAAILFALPIVCKSIDVRADVKPAALFSDHMVLQQGMQVPVWGWANPGEAVTVTFGDQKQSATTGADGKWMVHLNDLKSGPTEMTIAGKNTIRISDVLVGEVWLGSGQSNMVFTMSKDTQKYPGLAMSPYGVMNEESEIPAANYPQIRMFTVKTKLAEKPQDDVEGSWKVCSPETVPGFSAVGYFFSRQLQKSINRPMGFINSSYGASCAQAWISRDALEADAKYKPVLDSFDTALATFQQQQAARAANPQPATQPARGGAAPRAPRGPLSDQHQPFLLWNAMMKGLEPYAIRGVLWYQGESITTGGTAMYTELMNGLIQSWRKEFNQPNLPFYFVQLAALDNNSNRPEVREAQAKSLALPHTAMAVTIDIGNKSNVHPKNKQELGDRLAKIARANVYGEKIEFSGPVYESMQVDGTKIRLKFSHIGQGLISKDGDLAQFQIAGADKNFVKANATIDGDTIVVSAPELLTPAAVRYAWNRWPEGVNLYNKDGLPAAPFRTDSW